MSVLSAASEKQVLDILLKSDVVSEDVISLAKRAAESENTPLLTYMVKKGYVSDEQLTKANSTVTKVPYVNLLNAKVGPNVLKYLPQDIAKMYMAVPLGEIKHKLAIAMLDADNVQAIDFLSNRIGRPLKVYIASEAGIKHIIKQYESRLDTRMQEAFKNDVTLPDEKSSQEKKKQETTENIKTIVGDSPISKALSAILEFAAINRASDVHIEPTEKELKIRCRIDGLLREVMRLPKNTEPALISRVKILSNLKIDEHRIPQDGQFSIKVGKKDIDLRIAIAPLVWGEQVVIRLLDKTGTSLELEELGYVGRSLNLIREGLTQSNGMVLTSGPTGSGKSTSMYALLQEIKNEAINIITLEDPVEYKVEGVNQIQINPDVGLTFATGLRSILRQDPDVVMVGEIRDKETAQLAVQAALTGHLVFSTLHTNSAAGILPRLLDMGVEPFLIASTVRTVIGQRLVRRIDTQGKVSFQSSPPETESIIGAVGNLLPKDKDMVEKVSTDLGYKNLPLSKQNAYTLYKGTDTLESPGGYKGRMGLYEVFEVTEDVQELIMKRATSLEIEKIALKQGMINMRQDGYLKALVGLTTINEVNRVASEDNV